MTGLKELPPKAEMLKDTEREMTDRWAKGYKKHQAHMMGPAQVSIHPIHPIFLLLYVLLQPHRICCSFTSRCLFRNDSFQNAYYDDLSRTASIENLKPVMTKLHNDSSERFLHDLTNFRRDVYRIIDDETFIKIKG